MKTPLAWHNLAHNRLRTAAAVTGVMFAVLLIFLQLGFLGATAQTASLVYDALDFDLLVRSQRSRRLTESSPFARSYLDAAASVAGVQAVRPFYISFQRWRIPRGSNAGYRRRILIMGVRTGQPVFVPAEMQAHTALLTQPEFALVDRLSRAEFGPRNGRRFSASDLGSQSEVGGKQVELVGLYSLGASFEADGSLVLSDEGFFRLYPGWNPATVSLGLVKLDRPGVGGGAVLGQIRQILPPDVEVLTKADVIAGARHMWLWDMSIGMIFIMGVVVAFVVGAAIVYQILSSDVASHLPEFATLKAMGYRDSALSGVVLQEAVILSLLGFLPGLAAAESLYWLTHYVANVPIYMSLSRAVFVLGLSLAMCGASGVAALRKLRSADPADLFY